MKKSLNLWRLMTVLTLSLGFTVCGGDDGEPVDKRGSTPQYVWGTDGGLKSCNHLLFTNGEEDPNGKEIDNDNQGFIFKGEQTLKKGTYLPIGWVYIAEGPELTVEPSTVTKGDKVTKAALIAGRGGKFIAKGTPTEPIVFMSAQTKGNRKPGNWGGIILCGRTVDNQQEMEIEGGPRTRHGGSDNTDNSGVLSYVRIEFAGYPFRQDKKIDGLTLGSVGSGTQLDHIQVSYSNDDSYEWFGSAIDAKYLIAYKGWDDDFDADNGYCGAIQFGFVVRDSKPADASQSNGFESGNSGSGSAVEPYTTAQSSSVTLVGPKLGKSFQNKSDYITGGSMNPNSSSALGKLQSVMQIHRNSRLSCYNTLAVGYPIDLILDNEKGDTQSAATAGKLSLKNIWFAGMGAIGSGTSKEYEDKLITNYETKKADSNKKSFSTTFFLSQDSIVEGSWEDLTDTKTFRPLASSPLLNVASSAGLKGFKTVSYIGAFAANDNWADGWTEFDPEDTNYRLYVDATVNL